MKSAWRPRSMATLAAVAATGTLLIGCTGIPDGTEPVTGFELERYLGEWYEIARLDHSFEEGLDCVTATYSLRDDGGVKVINRGYNLEAQAWDEAEGRAYFIDDESVGRLKVSFFGPFYGGYNVLELDDDYQWALVAGPNRDYLWILARTPTLEGDVEQRLRQELTGTGVQVIRNGDTLQLVMPGNITFASGSSDIASSFYPTLNSLVKVFKEFDQNGINIVGHTDSTGSQELNMRLSRERATSVASYLSGQGVSGARISSAGVGPSQPIASNDTEAGRAQNRRVEITLRQL